MLAYRMLQISSVGSMRVLVARGSSIIIKVRLMGGVEMLKFRKLSFGAFLAICPSAAFANQNSPEMIIFGSLAMLALAGFVLFYTYKADSAAGDPENFSFADQATLPTKMQILLDENGVYSLVTIRQSGNVERVLENLTSTDVVLKIIQTMKKAKIETVSINVNGDKIQIYRVMHNGKGRQEGKRIGGFDVIRTGWTAKTSDVPQNKNRDLGIKDDDDPALEFNFDANNEAKKAIIKSFFSIVSSMKRSMSDDEMPNFPNILLENFDPETGEGRATLDASDLVTLLIFSDLHLSGEAEMNDNIREQFRSSDNIWQQKIGEDTSINTVTGILGYGSTTPAEIKEEFSQFWGICELFVSFDSKNPYRQKLNEIHRERMRDSRPKILDLEF